MPLSGLLKNAGAVIFDFDGTLVDSMWLWTDIDIEFLARFGHSFERSMQDDIEGMSITECALYFQERYGIPMTVEEMKQCWIDMSVSKYATEIGLKPYVREILTELKRAGIPMGICSSSHIDMIEACMDHNKIRDYFRAVTTACEVERGKPSPDIYLLAAKKIGADPWNCVAFEDVTQGLLAAKAAGMTAVGVYDRFSAIHESANREIADYYIRSFSEVLTGS